MASAAQSRTAPYVWSSSAAAASSSAVETLVREMEVGLPLESSKLDRHAQHVLGSLGVTSIALGPALARAALSAAREVLARLYNQTPPADSLTPDLVRLAQSLAQDGLTPDRVAELCLHGQERFLRGLATAAERAFSDAEMRWRVTRSAAAMGGVHLRHLTRLS
jgi:hypothetical protein